MPFVCGVEGGGWGGGGGSDLFSGLIYTLAGKASCYYCLDMGLTSI